MPDDAIDIDKSGASSRTYSLDKQIRASQKAYRKKEIQRVRDTAREAKKVERQREAERIKAERAAGAQIWAQNRQAKSDRAKEIAEVRRKAEIESLGKGEELYHARAKYKRAKFASKNFDFFGRPKNSPKKKKRNPRLGGGMRLW